jgi:small subunit ribosomal protein S27e
MDIDLLNPPHENQFQAHKLKRLVQTPQSYFLDVKAPSGENITTIFSHAQSVIYDPR